MIHKKPASAVIAFFFIAACGNSDKPAPPTLEVVGPPMPQPVNETGVPPTSDAQRIAFTGASVLTLADEGVLESTTVVIEAGQIVEIVPDAQFVADQDTQLIEADGRWLVPGLVDAHARFATELEGEKDLLLLLAAGVTTARVMDGSDTHRLWRDEIESGTRIGPRLRVTGPGLDGAGSTSHGVTIVANSAEGRAAVAAQAEMGYDAVMVHDALQLAPWQAIIDEADTRGIAVAGHIPSDVGVDLALMSGKIRSIEQFSRFEAEATAGNDWNTPLDGSKALALVEKIQLAGTWNVPTLVSQFRAMDQIDALEAHPAMAWISPGMLDLMRAAHAQPRATDSVDPVSRLELVKRLHDGGARLATGTNAGIRYAFPGFSLHEELQLFVDAGLSPEAAIRAATVSGSTLLGDALQSGTIEVGKRADLLLLAANPFDDIKNLNRRVGVMAAGRWYSQSHLMERVADQYVAGDDQLARITLDALPDYARYTTIMERMFPGIEGTGEDYDVSSASWLVYAPQACESRQCAVLIWVSPTESPRVNARWLPVLDENDVIIVFPEGAGNAHSVTRRRAPLALSGLAAVSAHYAIDSERVFVGGFSGGSKTAQMLAFGYPDIFKGAFLSGGFLDPDTHLVNYPPESYMSALKASSFYLLVGDRDDLAFTDFTILRNRLAQENFENVHATVLPEVGHLPPNGDSFRDGLSRLLLDNP